MSEPASNLVRMSEPVLNARALNRAMLERQLLSGRVDSAPLDAIEQLVGMQAQAPQAPYVGLWSRLAGFDPDAVSRLLTERALVRIGVMRGTVHLVSADDALYLRPLTQTLYDRHLRTTTLSDVETGRLDTDKLARVGRELVESEARTNGELRELLGPRWPEIPPRILAAAIRSLLPCIQVPPRGLWRASGQATVTTLESWLGRSMESAPTPDRLVARYLAACGPASVRDAQAWCGLSGLGEVFERLRSSLRVFRSEGGVELFDLPDAPRPAADGTLPVRFLPEYDNCLRAHADRSRMMSEQVRIGLQSKNDAPKPTVLVDGFVRATWKLERKRTLATVTVQPFVRPLSTKDTAATTAEGQRLLAFMAPESRAHDVRFADAIA